MAQRRRARKSASRRTVVRRSVRRTGRRTSVRRAPARRSARAAAPRATHLKISIEQAPTTQVARPLVDQVEKPPRKAKF